MKGKRTAQRALHTRLQNEAQQQIDSNQFVSSEIRVVHDRWKAFNEGLRVLDLELEAHLYDNQVAEDYASVAEYEDNAAATLALLSHDVEELKASRSMIPDSAATNITNNGFVTAGSRVFGNKMAHVFVAYR